MGTDGEDGRDRFARADALFAEALELPPDRRAAFLDRACAGDDALRSLLRRLLAGAETAPGDTWATGAGMSPFAGAIAGDVPDLTGRLLSDRYLLDGVLGRGGMGVVYAARDRRLEREVAIKVLRVPALDEATHARFLREARAAAALNHPNVVAVHDAGETDGLAYLVMERVRGESLDRRPPATLSRAVEIARGICAALAHAHERGVVHRDLKPGNVLVADESAGGAPTVKLTDMGIALTRGSARVTRTGMITGTPSYIAPEQALGQAVDGRTDLYALGVMLYEWSAGRLPFDGEDALAVVSQHIHAPVVPPRTFRPDLPAGLEPIILRLLAKAPEERFAGAADVAEALAAVGSSAAPTGPIEVTIEGLARGRMIGRREELARLQELWRGAGAGAPPLALVSGEPGVGKTRLARELTSAARLDGALVLAGGCYEHEAATPYLPYLEAFRRFVRERDDDALREALGDAASEIARLAPEIESRLGPFAPRPILSPQEERLRLFDHVARFLRGLAGRRGLLVFLDDLQWADHGSLALTHYLARQLGDERVLVLGTYREVELDRAHPLSKALVEWNRERLAVRVRLDRLDRDATGRMLATLLGQTDVPDDLAASLYDETEGNPFFLEEIVKALIAEGGLVHGHGAWRRRTTGEFVLPQSVKAAIGSRIERVGDACVEMLHVAAVLGKSFEFGELVSVSDRTEDELIETLDEAVAAQLLVAGRGESFAFTHDKIREVLYEELNPIRRRRLHGRIAAGLARLHEAGSPVAVEDLAYHFVASGDDDRGLEWAGRAAEAAAAVFAWDEALEMLARARDCAEALGRAGDVARLDEAAGDASFARGDMTAAADHYERVLGATIVDPDRINAVRGKVGEVYVTSGDRRGAEHVRRALAELDPDRLPRETAQARLIEARFLHIDGRLEEAVRHYLPAIELAERAGDADLIVRARAYLAGTYQHMAKFEESDAESRRCIEIGERENLPAGVMLGCEFLQENCYYRGDWEDGIRFGEREEAIARETHAGERWLWSHMRAFMVAESGRLAEAERLFRRAIAEAEIAGERRLRLFVELGLASCLVDVGKIDEADALGRRAADEADAADLISHRIAGRALRMPAMLAMGRIEEALASAREGLALWFDSGSTGVGLIYGPDLAHGLIAGGAPADEIVPVLERHAELAERTGAVHRAAQNRGVRGRLAARDGRVDEALDLLGGALAGFEARGSVMQRIHTLRHRAEALEGVGRGEDAIADRDLARSLLDRARAS